MFQIKIQEKNFFCSIFGTGEAGTQIIKNV